MSTIELTDDNFEDTIEQGGIVIVDFWADGCGPCKQFAPIFGSSSEQHPAV